MWNTLKVKYLEDLKKSLTLSSLNIASVGECKEERALTYGNGRPIYLTDVPLPQIDTPSSGTSLTNIQENILLYAVKPTRYSYNQDIFTIVDNDKQSKLTFNTKGVVAIDGEKTKKITSRTSYTLLYDRDYAITITCDDVETTYLIEYNKVPKYSLLGITDVLIGCLEDDDFYGLTTSIGEQILHISHPMVLDGLLKSITDPEELLFDNTWLYKFKHIPTSNNRNVWHERYFLAVDILKDANKLRYSFNSIVTDNNVNISESYGDSSNFYATVPIHVAYYGHVSYPYYGLEHVNINEGNPTGRPFWAITSPNVDTYNSWDVCTGTSVKTVEGVSMLFNGNFSSTFPTSDKEGTFREGWVDAMNAMITHTKIILNKELGTDFSTVVEQEKHFETIQRTLTSRLSTSNIRKWMQLYYEFQNNNMPLDAINIDNVVLSEYIEVCTKHLEATDVISGIHKDVEHTMLFAKSIIER